jgi:hypothetical protein
MNLSGLPNWIIFKTGRHSFITAIILLNCSSPPKEQFASGDDSSKIDPSKVPATEFVDAIHSCLHCNCLSRLAARTVVICHWLNRTARLSRKFIPGGTGLVGLIERNESYISLLTTFAADGLVPVVRVYDLNGKQISERSFMTDYCGRPEPEYLQTQHFRIGADKVLSETDSSFTFLVDSTYSTIFDTTKIEISETRYHMNKAGLIIEIDSKKKHLK